jgi:glycosyltransferase involved in cell wall biosynthesis
MEYMLAGIPVVAISKQMAQLTQLPQFDFYEVEEILQSCGGLVARSITEMQEMVGTLLSDHEYAKTISKRQVEKAKELFDVSTISQQWKGILQ